LVRGEWRGLTGGAKTGVSVSLCPVVSGAGSPGLAWIKGS